MYVVYYSCLVLGIFNISHIFFYYPFLVQKFIVQRIQDGELRNKELPTCSAVWSINNSNTASLQGWCMKEIIINQYLSVRDSEEAARVWCCE